MNDGKYFDAWAIVYDGEIASKEETGIGIIHGYDFAAMEDLLSSGELYEAMTIEKIAIPDNALTVNFRGTNLYRESGQQTFPETGQWDFPPYWEFDLEVTGFDYMPEFVMSPPVDPILTTEEDVSIPF